MQTKALPFFFGKIFNLSRHELGRVAITWGFRLLYYLGFFTSWTITIALFVGSFGIFYLPLLYVSQALLSIIGSLLYSRLIYRLSLEKLVSITIIGLFISLVAAISLFGNVWIFFFFLQLVTAIFLPQLDILLSRTSEEMFTPLESQRVLPFIDSTEPLGGILSGIILSLFIEQFHAETFLPMIGGVFIILLIVYMAFMTTRKQGAGHSETPRTVVSIRRGIEHLKAIPFMRGMALIVFLWIIAFNITEIQFTKTIEEMLHHAEEVGHGVEAVMENNALKDVLAERLGSFQIIFSSLVLIMQLFFSSRILKRLGLIKSFLCMPAISVIGSVGALFGPGILFPGFLKGSMDTIGGVQKIAYHNSYYAITEHMREHIRELMEGIIKPVGIIISTLFIFLVQNLFHGTDRLVINTLLTVVFVVMFLLTLRLQRDYTSVAKKNLEMSKEFGLKSHAIEVLSQKGHDNAADILSKALIYRKELPEVKVKILRALGEIEDPLSLPEILLCLNDPSLEVKIAACQALSRFKHLGKHFYTQAFSQHRIISTLSEVFKKESSKRLRSAIIKTFANIQHAQVVPFLLDIIAQANDEELISDCIYVIGLFGDINTWHYVSPFLTSTNPRIKANAIIALWQFEKYRLQLLIHLLSLLESKEKNANLSGIYAVGEIKAIQELPVLKKFLESDDADIVRYTAVALLKLDEQDAVQPILQLLFGENSEVAYKTFEAVQDSKPNSTRTTLFKYIKTEGGTLVNQLFHEHHLHHSQWDQLPPEKIERLIRYYTILGHEKEVFLMKEKLKNMHGQ